MQYIFLLIDTICYILYLNMFLTIFINKVLKQILHITIIWCHKKLQTRHMMEYWRVYVFKLRIIDSKMSLFNILSKRYFKRYFFGNSSSFYFISLSKTFLSYVSVQLRDEESIKIFPKCHLRNIAGASHLNFGRKKYLSQKKLTWRGGQKVI